MHTFPSNMQDFKAFEESKHSTTHGIKPSLVLKILHTHLDHTPYSIQKVVEDQGKCQERNNNSLCTYRVLRPTHCHLRHVLHMQRYPPQGKQGDLH